MGGLLRDNPCKHCDRHCDICHSVCLYYKEWYAAYQELKNEEAKEKAVDVALSNHRKDSIMRTVKKKGLKNRKGRR